MKYSYQPFSCDNTYRGFITNKSTVLGPTARDSVFWCTLNNGDAWYGTSRRQVDGKDYYRLMYVSYSSTVIIKQYDIVSRLRNQSTFGFMFDFPTNQDFVRKRIELSFVSTVDAHR